MSETIADKRDRWIPWYFVAFFVVLAILDGIFVYLATSSHTGVVTKNSYLKGLNYNETVAAAEAQAALGWRGEINHSASGTLGFTLAGNDGLPLEGAIVTAELMRPTHEGQDFRIELSEAGPGTYAADAAFPLKGLWDVRVFVEWNQQQYQQSARLIVK